MAWRREPGGGVVLINLIHVVDDLRNLCGDIVCVQAVASNAARGFPVEDTAAILLRFRSGALGTLSISDCAAAPWSWEMTAGENKAYPQTSEACYLVAGSEGSLSVPRLEIWRHADARAWFGSLSAERMIVPEEDPLTRQMRHFCAVIRREVAPVIDAREAARTLAATLAVTRAAESGHTVGAGVNPVISELRERGEYPDLRSTIKLWRPVERPARLRLWPPGPPSRHRKPPPSTLSGPPGP